MTPDHTTENPEAVMYRAAEIKQQIKALETEYEMLTPQVMARVKELSHDKEHYALQVGELGTFSVVQKKVWTYTDQVKQLDSMLKEKKAEEEATGDATFTVKEYAQFRELEP